MLSLSLIIISLWGQAPQWYYNSAVGKSGTALKNAVKQIINPHTIISYDNVWLAYKYTDADADGLISDIYTDCDFIIGENQCGQTSGTVCICYNREHAFCQSWFKTITTDNTKTAMYTDLYHLYPTDGKVNSTRNNNPYGETSSGFTQVGTGKLGVCDFPTPGYTGKIFEPSDEYKGDLARTYFYFFTCYADSVPTWVNCPIISDGVPREWAIDMLIKWHTNDPVSQKEIDRNNAIYNIQLNRNPFIDYPELVGKIYGADETAFIIPKSDQLVTIYYEDCGTPSSTIALSSHKWRNSHRIKYSGTADVRSTQTSAKYATSSGAGNIWLANGNKHVKIEGINTTGYAELSLYFGLRCEQKGAQKSMLTVEYSVDGEIWNPLTISAGFPLSSGWSRVQCLENIPATKSLKLRFTNNQTAAFQFRIDDIMIIGLKTAQSPSASIYFIGDETETMNTFNNSVEVNMYCVDDEAVVSYSLDESEPSIVYSEPFVLDKTTTIKAIAHNTDLSQSEINTESVTIVNVGIDDNYSDGNQHSIISINNRISIKSSSSIKTVSVFNTLGEIMHFVRCEDDNYEVVLYPNIPKGIYIVKALTENGSSIIQKIISH